jgi:diaminohydroxyphosphoribosylaminopyrimidine deaminase/5-amino-6-(5-phosphoribosylamino)uracil reductase
MFALPSPPCLSLRQALRFHEVSQIGEDIRILARFAQKGSGALPLP